jgi:hypothetical protein
MRAVGREDDSMVTVNARRRHVRCLLELRNSARPRFWQLKTKLHYFTAGGRGELPVLALPMLSLLPKSAGKIGPGLNLPAGCGD